MAHVYRHLICRFFIVNIDIVFKRDYLDGYKKRTVNHKLKTISAIAIIYIISYPDNPQYSPTVHILNLSSALNVGQHQAIVQEQRNVYRHFVYSEPITSKIHFKYT